LNRLRNLVLLAAALGAPVAQGAQNRPPAISSAETVKFKLLWPSGVTLGEAVLSVTPAKGEVRFEMTMEAATPIRNFSAAFSSVATADGLCSLQFHRKTTEGAKSSEESIEFDQNAHLAKRTLNGQTTAIPMPECARDVLTFLYYFRNQLAAGHPAATASVYLGPDRSLEIQHAGAEKVTVAGREQSADKYSVTYRRPGSARSFDVWFSSGARREPLLVRLPTPLATFSAELE